MFRFLHGVVLFAFRYQLEVVRYLSSGTDDRPVIVMQIVAVGVASVFVLIVLLPIGIRAEEVS